MLKKYLEIIEETSPDAKEAPKIVKIKVKDEKEAKTKLLTEKSAFSGLDYKARYHICHHYENADRNKKCELFEL